MSPVPVNTTNGKRGMPDYTDYYDFSDLVNNDVRDETNDEDAEWLRRPENLARFGRELLRLELTVTTQLEMSDSAWQHLPQGGKRDHEKRLAEKKSTGRKFYRERVRDRIAEVEDLIGSAPVTAGQVRLYVDAALDALDASQGDRAVKLLENLLDMVDPPASDVA